MKHSSMRGFAKIAILTAMLAAAPALAADKSDLAGRAAKWEKAYNADDIKGVAALYAADGCRMPPNAKTSQGNDGVLANLKAGKDNGLAKLKIAVTKAESSGDLAYGMGTYEGTRADGTKLDAGKWMNVSKKAKGKWLIQCDIWNSDSPPPAPAPVPAAAPAAPAKK
jgi:ketosteroid isomerase-like protein